MSGLADLTREELIELINAQHQEIEALKGEVEMLRSILTGGGSGSSAAPFVKPNRQQRREAERKARKKRSQSFARKRDVPTETVEHAVDICPDCGRKLSGGWVHSRRQVVEIPETPIRVIEHLVIARRCGVCGKRVIPKLELSSQVVGKSRFGAKLMSLIADMATNCRIAHRTIQQMLKSLYGLEISLGEISEVLHRVAQSGKQAYNDLLWEIRGSPVVNADETGWREDGVNGYIWSFSTPEVRYLLRDKSRSSRLVTETLGDEFSGVLVSDFYGAYNAYGGVKQRCWVHLLRDLKKLVEKHPKDESVAKWAGEVKLIYDLARDISGGQYSQIELCLWRQHFETRLLKLALPYRDAKKAPQRVLAKRIETFLGELFSFVDHEAVPSDNNAAERAVRPAVILRKMSGGSRSPKGSDTRMTLLSLFGTWKLQAKNPLAACASMLTARP
ncbi:MAG: IS66 family transposase [Dehalococcoidia bacterium]|nr:IS66 family transposase [Dehalococcoidia bacterium]